MQAAKNAAGFLVEEMVKAGLALDEEDGDLAWEDLVEGPDLDGEDPAEALLRGSCEDPAEVAEIVQAVSWEKIL